MSPPKKPRHSGVYAILDKKSGWHYIGSSKDMEARRRHCWRLYSEGRGHNRALQYAWSLHGEDNFEFFYLEECSEGALVEREYFWIKSWQGQLFNILRDARRVGPMSAETRALLSERAKAQHAAGLLGRRV